MRRFLALIRRETAAIFLNAPTLFATAFFVLLSSFAFYLVAIRSTDPVARFEDIAIFMLDLSVILYPFVVRHSFSADNANGTLENFLTSPVSRSAVVLSKYLAAMLFVVAHLLVAVVYAALLSYGGNLDWQATLCALLALAAVGSVFVSVSMFISSLTASPAISMLGSCGLLVFFGLTSELDPYSGVIPDILYSASFLPPAKRWIGGMLDSRGIVYFVSVTLLFLFYAWLSVSTREVERLYRDATVKRRLSATYVLVCACFCLLLLQTAILNINGYWETGSPLGHNLNRIPWRYFIPAALAAVTFVWAGFTYRSARRAQYFRTPFTAGKYATISETRVSRAPRYYFEDNIRARRFIVLASLAALAIAVNLNWLAHYPFRTFEEAGRLSFLAGLQAKSWDLTHERKNSLSPETIRALDILQGRMQFYSFLPDNLHVRDVPVAREVRNLIGRYADNNPLVSAIYADFQNEPTLVRDLALELDLPSGQLRDTVIAAYQGRRVAIPAAAFVAAPDSTRREAGDTRWVFDGENRLTQAILHVVDPRIPKVLFSYGHLEHSLASSAAPERSVSRFAQALAAANMRTQQHSITVNGPIPEDCDIFAVISPRMPHWEEEVEEISRFLERGGSLLVFAPPAGGDNLGSDDHLNKFLHQLGGSCRDDLVLDPVNNDNKQETAVRGVRFSRPGEGPNFVFPRARSIRDNPLVGENGWHSRRTIQSLPTAYSRSHDSLGRVLERAGPFTLLYRSVKPTENGEARAAVFASGELVSNAGLGRGMNLTLAVATTQWLAGFEETANIDVRRWVDRRLMLTGPQVRIFLWVSLVALPLLWLLAGISAWWLRRE